MVARSHPSLPPVPRAVAPSLAPTFGLPSAYNIGARTKLRPRDAVFYRNIEPPLLAEVIIE